MRFKISRIVEFISGFERINRPVNDNFIAETIY